MNFESPNENNISKFEIYQKERYTNNEMGC